MSKVPRLSNRATGGGTSVYEWGVLGDGTFNETLKIQRALDNLQHVYFPPGTYLVDGSLTASIDKQVIEGAGKGSVIKMMAGKTYDLTKEHAALTMNAGEQTVQDLQLIGPDTGDDSTFSGSGSDWYNLAALRVDSPSASVNGVKIDRCEGAGMAVSQPNCKISLCRVERTGLNGISATARQQCVLGSHFHQCAKTTYGNITTYPSGNTFAVHLQQDDCIISGSYFIDNARDIMCQQNDHVISSNTCFSGVHVEAIRTVVSNNLIRASGKNALTVANDGQSAIASLVGNHVNPMNQGGTDDIIARTSYSRKPVIKATANDNPDIDRIYQQKAYAQIRTENSGNNSDGSIPMRLLEKAQLIVIDTTKDTLAVDRDMLVQISGPPIRVNTDFTKGWFAVRDETNDSEVTGVYTRTSDNSTNNTLLLMQTTLQVRLQPNITYKFYVFENDAGSVADVRYDDEFVYSLIEVE